MTAATTTTTSMEAEQQQPDDHRHKTEKPEEKNKNKNNKRKTERSSESKKAKKTKKKTKKEEKKRKRTATVKDTDDDNSDEATRDTNANTQDGKTGSHDVSKTTTQLPYSTDTNEERSNGDDDDDNEGGGGEDGGDERKIFLSRIPTKFDADSITRLFELSFGEGCVQHIALPHVRTEDEEEDGEGGGVRGRDGKSMAIDGKHAAKPKGGGDRKGDEEEEEGDHRGFAFVTMSSVDKRDEAVEKGTIRGAVKETSKKKHTMYIRSIVRNDDQDGEGTTTKDATADLHVCYLWSKRRCPYGDTCKFNHVGEGGCVVTNQNTNGNNRKKKLKCFAFQSKGGCKIGDDCPYSHDIQNKHDKAKAAHHVVKEKKEKDCINWKSKGKCRRMDTCPYRHDNAVRDARLTKKCERPSKKQRKDNPQPLSVRVFGLNYDTKVIDVEKHFTHCGVIKEVTFPVYEDSGRSKGYCGILFTSPKATEKACELDGKELFGRWLSVQPGKMYLKQWAEMEKTRLDGRKDAKSGNDTEGTAPVQTVGEFGQKVKTRKKHGFKV